MKMHKEDGTPREPYDIVLELESRLLPMVQTAYLIINSCNMSDEAHAIACGVMHYVEDLREALEASSDWQHVDRSAGKEGVS